MRAMSPIRALFACLLIGVASIVQAAPAPDSVYLEDLTWTELRDR
jgi:hypothetical protein